MPGIHNVRNATAALAAARRSASSRGQCGRALAGYRGVGRRFELRGRKDGVTYIDDYAHNPGKVRATLAAARLGDWGRIVAVFQPHRYSRTAALLQRLRRRLRGGGHTGRDRHLCGRRGALPGVDARLVADAVSASHPALPVEYAESRS